MIEAEADARSYCKGVVGDGAFGLLEQFVRLLRVESERQNLVASASLGEVWRRHVADSLQLLRHVPRGTGEWLDLGSGAGFPGLVVAIAEPERPVILIESRRLRAEWLHFAAEELDLRNALVLECRVEKANCSAASVISARAFAPLEKLLRLSARFSTPHTAWVLPKGRSAREELRGQSRQIQRMFHVEPSLTDGEAGILIGRGVPQL